MMLQSKNDKLLTALSPPQKLLPNKQYLPLIGLGTYKLQEQKQLTDLLRQAIIIGYRHIDTARLYNNQIPLGKALKTLFNQSVCKRQDLFIATKTFPHKNLKPLDQLKQSLRLMDLKYVDVFYMHWPFVDLNQNNQWNHLQLEKYWMQMQQCIHKGYTKHLGISNFNGQLTMELLTICKIKPIINQIETHPYLNQQSLVDICQKNDIAVIASSPLCRGSSCVKENTNILQDQLIVSLAQNYEAKPGQIVLSFDLCRNIGIIPKTSNFTRLRQNFQSWKIKLSSEDIQKMMKMDRNLRISDGSKLFKYFGVFD